MKLSEKLDCLQGLAQVRAADRYALYLIGLLAEHAEEEEVTAGLLEWLEGLLGA